MCNGQQVQLTGAADGGQEDRNPTVACVGNTRETQAWWRRWLISRTVSPRIEVQNSQQAKEDQSRIQKESHYQTCNVIQSHERILDLETHSQRQDRGPKESGEPKGAPEEQAGCGRVGLGIWTTFCGTNTCLSSYLLCFPQYRFQNLWRSVPSDLPGTCEHSCMFQFLEPPNPSSSSYYLQSHGIPRARHWWFKNGNQKINGNLFPISN